MPDARYSKMTPQPQPRRQGDRPGQQAAVASCDQCSYREARGKTRQDQLCLVIPENSLKQLFIRLQEETVENVLQKVPGAPGRGDGKQQACRAAKMKLEV